MKVKRRSRSSRENGSDRPYAPPQQRNGYDADTLQSVGNNPGFNCIPITGGGYDTGDVTDGATLYNFSQQVSKAISQKIASDATRRYLKVDNSNVTMTTAVDDKCEITINVYNPYTGSSAQVITLCNASNSEALGAKGEETSNEKEIEMTSADNLTSNGNISLDKRFFYHRYIKTTDEYVFELVERTDHYLAFESSTGGLKLVSPRVTSVNNLPAECKFCVCKWDDIHKIAKPSQLKRRKTQASTRI